MVYFFVSMFENKEDCDLATFLYEENRQNVYKIAMSYLKNPHQAEDAVSEVFLRVYKNISQFRGLDCNKQSGLIVVYSRNLLRNILKRNKIFTFDEFDEATVSSDDRVEDFVVEQDSYRRILNLFELLDEKYAEVCKLKYHVDLSNTEIAKALDLSNENVRVRLHRSKVMIRKLLEKEGARE